jgi:hypothetical protein
MPSPQSVRLTEAHRLAQSRLGVSTVARVDDLWALLDVTDLDATSARWLRAVLAVVDTQSAQSARLAAAYFDAYRALEVGSRLPAQQIPPIDVAAVQTSLTVTGPVKVKTLTAAGQTISTASDVARAASAAAAQRHTLNAGRSLLLNSVRNDQQARGWARRASGGACAFCAMLASRGGEYGNERTADFEAHDGCGCTVEPIYSGDGLDDTSSGYRDLWETATRGVPSGQQLAAFRAALGAPA